MLHLMLHQILQNSGNYVNKMEDWLGKVVAQNLPSHKYCWDCILILQLHADSSNSEIYEFLIFWIIV